MAVGVIYPVFVCGGFCTLPPCDNFLLCNTDETDFPKSSPKMLNDVFSIQFTISNNLTQQNTRGKVLDTIGANVERKINLIIQLNIYI